MNILHTVEFYAPSVGGAQSVVRQVSNELVRRGHSVTVATTRLAARTTDVIDGVRVVGFDIRGSAVQGITGDVRAYQQFLLDGSFDVVMNYAAQQWATDLVFPVLDRLRAATVLVPCGFSGLYEGAYADYFAQLPDVMRRYDRVVLHGLQYRDAVFAREHGLTNCRLVPNGASAEEFSRIDPSFRERYGIPADVPLLLTVGSHTGAKGHRETIEAFRRSRLHRAVLVVIGNRFAATGCHWTCRSLAWLTRASSRGRKRVLVLDPPRADVVAAFHAADLFVFASRIECSPLVLFEAMASGTAFVTSRCGNAEEIAAWSEGGIVVPTTAGADGQSDVDIGALGRIIDDLMQDSGRRQRLAAHGMRAWQERFTWGHIGGLYEQLYADALAARTA